MKQLVPIVALAVLLFFVASAGAGNTATITVNLNNTATAAIIVNPIWWNTTAGIGEIEASTGGHFRLNNTGTITVNVTIKGNNTAYGWNLSTSPGHNHFHLQYNLTGGGWQNILVAPSSFVNQLSPVPGLNSKTFDLKLEMPTSSSNSHSQQTQITLTATSS